MYFKTLKIPFIVVFTLFFNWLSFAQNTGKYLAMFMILKPVSPFLEQQFKF